MARSSANTFAQFFNATRYIHAYLCSVACNCNFRSDYRPYPRWSSSGQIKRPPELRFKLRNTRDVSRGETGAAIPVIFKTSAIGRLALRVASVRQREQKKAKTSDSGGVASGRCVIMSPVPPVGQTESGRSREKGNEEGKRATRGREERLERLRALCK